MLELDMRQQFLRLCDYNGVDIEEDSDSITIVCPIGYVFKDIDDRFFTISDISRSDMYLELIYILRNGVESIFTDNMKGE
jgi:hypothetical protein